MKKETLPAVLLPEEDSYGPELRDGFVLFGDSSCKTIHIASGDHLDWATLCGRQPKGGVDPYFGERSRRVCPECRKVYNAGVPRIYPDTLTAMGEDRARAIAAEIIPQLERAFPGWNWKTVKREGEGIILIGEPPYPQWAVALPIPTRSHADARKVLAEAIRAARRIERQAKGENDGEKA